LLAAGLGIALLGRDGEPTPATPAPRIVSTIRVGGQPQDGVLAAGSFWLADATGRVLRIDPGSHRVIATFKTDAEATALSATDAAVWVSTMRRSGIHTLTRIDPATDRIVASLESHRLFAHNLAASPRALWVQLDKQPPVRLQRLDPRTNTLAGDYSRRWLSAMAVHEGILWTLSVDGVLERRDADTGRLLSRAGGFGAFPPGGPFENGIAPGPDGAWVVTGATGRLHRVSAAGKIERTIAMHAGGPIVQTAGSLWVMNDDTTARKAELTELDAATGAVRGRLFLGTRMPHSLVAVGDDVWAVIGDGTVLVMR